MNYIEEHVARQNASGTFLPNFVIAAFLGLSLVPSYKRMSGSSQVALGPQIRLDQASGTLETTVPSAEPTDGEIIQQLGRIFSYLSVPQEIDADSHRILYSNLWTLFE